MRILIYFFLFSFSNTGLSNPTSSNEQDLSSFKNLPVAISCKVFNYLDDSYKFDLRTSSNYLWQHFKPWSNEKKSQGLFVKKPKVGFVFLPDEIQKSSVRKLSWAYTLEIQFQIEK